MPVKLYQYAGSPPSFAVRACLVFLKVPHELLDVPMRHGEHLKEEYKKKNPNCEVPCLEDDGFYLSESAAILQYLAEKYKKDETFYPSNLQERAKINHLLAFNNTSLYRSLLELWYFTTIYAYPKMKFNMKKMKHFLGVFNNILGQHKGPYAAGTAKVTIADVHLLQTPICLDACGFDFSPYPNVAKWYGHMQKNEPDIWKLGQELLDILKPFGGPLDPAITALLPKSHPYHPCNPSEYV